MENKLARVLVFVFCLCLSFRAKGEIVFLENGKGRGSIVIGDGPGRLLLFDSKLENASLYAAEFLQRHIEKATGVRLPIRKESENPQKPYLLIGETRIGEKNGITGKGLPGEGYLIKSFPEGVAIVGEVSEEGIDRGTLNGVYRFLEETLKIRWYFAPEELGTVIPFSARLSLPDNLSLSGAPFFPYRMGGISHWKTAVAQAWHPVLRFGFSRGLSSNHTHNNWYQYYGKSHPEYFALKEDGSRALNLDPDGKNRTYLCLSEPGVLKQHLENVDEYFKTGNIKPWVGGGAKPRGNNIPFGPNDVPRYCVCENCLKKITPERGRHGAASNLVFDFLYRYASEVKKKHPQAVIWSLAYQQYKLPPTSIEKFPDNVGITLCLIPTVVVQNQPGVRESNRQLILDWFQLVNRNPERLIIWDYFCYPNTWFIAPTEIPHVLKDHINFLKDKALGIFNNGFNPETKADMPQLYLTYRIVWLMHRLLWNPDLDLDKARHDWCHDLFGPAGEEMEKFYSLLEERWEKVKWSQEPAHSNVGSQQVYLESYPPEILRELRAIYQKAISRTEESSIYRKRLDWFYEKAYGPFFKEAEKFHQAAGSVPSYQAVYLKDFSVKEANIFEQLWQRIPVYLELVEKVSGNKVEEKSQVKIGYDDENFYVAAWMKLKKETEEIVARAEGRENPEVEQDDKFIIHLQPEKAEGYIELIVNPKGSFSSRYDIMPSPRRGFFPSHKMLEWDTQKIVVTGKKLGDGWAVAVAIPWNSLPGTKTVCEKLRGQFIRWNARDGNYRFTVWSPVLDPWYYSLSRFGWLIFKPTPEKEKTVIIPAGKKQIGYISATGEKPAQPEIINQVVSGEEKEHFLVGQRDLSKKSWLELRGILKFSLSPLRQEKGKIKNVFLELTRVNAVGKVPFDNLVVDLIDSSTPEEIVSADYQAKVIHPEIAMIPAPVENSKQKLVLDVSEPVKRQVESGKNYLFFRVRVAGGCTFTDGQLRYSVFSGVKDSEAIPRLKFILAES